MAQETEAVVEEADKHSLRGVPGGVDGWDVFETILEKRGTIGEVIRQGGLRRRGGRHGVFDLDRILPGRRAVTHEKIDCPDKRQSAQSPDLSGRCHGADSVQPLGNLPHMECRSGHLIDVRLFDREVCRVDKLVHRPYPSPPLKRSRTYKLLRYRELFEGPVPLVCEVYPNGEGGSRNGALETRLQSCRRLGSTAGNKRRQEKGDRSCDGHTVHVRALVV